MSVDKQERKTISLEFCGLIGSGDSFTTLNYITI
jgi:hypothetical protein